MYKPINSSIEGYLNGMKVYFKLKKEIENFQKVKTGEQDNYQAYGFIWEIKFLHDDWDLKSILTFNYKKFENFDLFLEKYGNSKIFQKITVKILIMIYQNEI